MSPSKVLFFLCFSFIIGIFVESLIELPQYFIWGFLVLSLIIIFLSLVNQIFSRALILGFCVMFFVLGILRMQISEFNIANDRLSKMNGSGQIVVFGTISNEPDVRDTFQKLEVKIDSSIVLVTTSKYPEYKYLDAIELTGKLEEPVVTDTFNYKNYLMKDGIYSVMNFPKIKVLHTPGVCNFLDTPGVCVYSWILFCKQKVRESIQHNFLPPQSSILEGTILGDNGAMSNDLKEKLNITGLRHIIAVSGTHVVILSAIIMSLLITAGLWRGQAFYFAITFVCIYVILTGLPPSGVRAGIMGGIFLLSQKIGRQAMGARVITLACFVMLLINPLLLFYDVGFQLSFLAVLGLIYLEPLIKKFIKVSILSTTFAAQIFTLPIMVYNFGNISFASPFTNLLILPIVSWLMIFGFLTSIVGIFSNALGWIFSVPSWFLLTYFVKVIDLFSQPWMAKNIENVSWVWIFVSYFGIAIATQFLNKKYCREFI